MIAHTRDAAPTTGRPRPRWLAPVILAAALGVGLAFAGIVSMPVVLSVAASGGMLLMHLGGHGGHNPGHEAHDDSPGTRGQ